MWARKALSKRVRPCINLSISRRLCEGNKSDAAKSRSSSSDRRFLEYADPRLLRALQSFGIDSTYPEVTYHKLKPLLSDSPLNFKLDFYQRVEKGFEKMNSMLADGLLSSKTAEEAEIVTIKGEQNNTIELHFCRPKDKALKNQHCILHLHGGGMSILSTTDPIYRATRLRLAELGFTVVGVEFRNAAGRLGAHRFPAGLNDCLDALEFVNSKKDALEIEKVIAFGESGGGNLAISLALYAKQLGKLDWIDGVYAMCPYIYGDYDYTKLDSYPESLRKNEGLLLPRGQEMYAMARLYLPEDAIPSQNPLAWPYHATESDVEGLPPHVISVNDLDPLCDEGLEYCKKLIEANVNARSRVVPGTCHAGEILFMKYIPDLLAGTLEDVQNFAKGL